MYKQTWSEDVKIVEQRFDSREPFPFTTPEGTTVLVVPANGFAAGMHTNHDNPSENCVQLVTTLSGAGCGLAMPVTPDGARLLASQLLELADLVDAAKRAVAN